MDQAGAGVSAFVFQQGSPDVITSWNNCMCSKKKLSLMQFNLISIILMGEYSLTFIFYGKINSSTIDELEGHHQGGFYCKINSSMIDEFEGDHQGERMFP